jgi:hypothetical protein
VSRLVLPRYLEFDGQANPRRETERVRRNRHVGCGGTLGNG